MRSDPRKNGDNLDQFQALQISSSMYTYATSLYCVEQNETYTSAVQQMYSSKICKQQRTRVKFDRPDVRFIQIFKPPDPTYVDPQSSARCGEA